MDYNRGMSAEDKPQFDPYYEWLGIPPAEQPPNLYRLLGLQKFESDPDVIENAADRQMLYLRQMQSSPRWFYAEALLTVIARAKLELLDAQRRMVYDRYLQQLEQTAAQPQRPIPLALPVSLTTGADPVRPTDPQPAAVEPATPYFQSAISATDTSPAGRRRSKPVSRSGLIRIVGIVLGGPTGILIGLWLAKVLLGVDFFNPATQPKSSPKATATRQPPAAAPSPVERPRPTPAIPAAKSPPTPSVEPEPIPSIEQQRPRDAMPAPGPADILAALPNSVDLPSAVNASPVTLFSVPGDASLLKWSLSSGAADLPEGAALFCRPANNDVRRWTFFYAPDGADLNSGIIPIAKVQALAGEMQFQWTTAAGDEALQTQLCNCLLAAHGPEQTRTIQLRRPLSLQPLELDLDQKESSLDFALENPPRPASLLLEITAVPTGGAFEDGTSSAPVNKPVVVQFAELTGAELSLELHKRATAGQFSLGVTPEFVEGPKLKFELTRPKLGEMTKRWSEMGQKAALTIKQAESRVSALKSRLEELSEVSGNISVMAERNRQMTAVRDRIKIEVERLPTHRKRLLEAQARLNAAPAVEKFLAARDQSPIRFRMIAESGQDRIVLAESQ